MRMKKTCHDLVLKQLHQYPYSKCLISEYEKVSLKAHQNGLKVISGSAPDPTANEAMRLIEPDKRIKPVYDWVWAIESAYEMFLNSSSERAKLMEYLFGLNGRETIYSTGTKREALIDLMHISEPTLYRWREEIIDAVMFGALQKGLISVYNNIA